MENIFKRIVRWALSNELKVINALKTELSDRAQKLEGVYNRMENSLEATRKLESRMESRIWEFDEKSKKLSRCEEILKSLDVTIDIDCHRDGESWAVISLRGEKTDYLQFVDLRGKDIREIQHFLKRYEYTNVKTDLPFMMGRDQVITKKYKR